MLLAPTSIRIHKATVKSATPAEVQIVWSVKDRLNCAQPAKQGTTSTALLITPLTSVCPVRNMDVGLAQDQIIARTVWMGIVSRRTNVLLVL